MAYTPYYHYGGLPTMRVRASPVGLTYSLPFSGVRVNHARTGALTTSYAEKTDWLEVHPVHAIISEGRDAMERKCVLVVSQ